MYLDIFESWRGVENIIQLTKNTDYRMDQASEGIVFWGQGRNDSLGRIFFETSAL